MKKNKIFIETVQKENLIALAFILGFIVFSYLSMRNLSLTTDENKHYTYGVKILNLDSNRIVYTSEVVDDSKMPISALNALPAKIAEIIPDQNIKYLPEGRIKEFLKAFSTARLITILFSALVAWLVFYWSRTIYGFIPGIISLLLYILDPNIIAHSQLVTTDVYSIGTALFCFYYLWKFSNHKSWQDGLLLAVMLGISQLAKYSSLLLYPLVLAVLIIHDWVHAHLLTSLRKTGIYFRKILLWMSMAAIINLVIINFGYLFNRAFTPVSEYQFHSDELKSFQRSDIGIGNLPVPVPYPYLQGLDLVRYNERTGNGYGPIYLLGKLSNTGFKGYYFIASLFKVPIATQILLLLAIIIYFKDKERYQHIWHDEIFLLFGVMFYVIYFNLFFNAQMGIRYYLVIYPFLYIFSGHLFKNWHTFSRTLKIGSLVLGGYLLLSVLSYFPHYLSYFNEFVWDRKMAYEYLADSNLDWRQDKNYLAEYCATHPEVVYVPDSVVTGQIIVSVNDLVGISGDPNTFRWLRDNFEPDGTISYSYLIYDISQQDLEMICQSKNICP